MESAASRPHGPAGKPAVQIVPSVEMPVDGMGPDPASGRGRSGLFPDQNKTKQDIT